MQRNGKLYKVGPASNVITLAKHLKLALRNHFQLDKTIQPEEAMKKALISQGRDVT